MFGLLATIAGLFLLLMMCANITTEKFNEAIKKQHEQWDQ
ncbi:hypothetical protein EDD64_1467 [Effusibacillus lacus]|nr:hypothetical protein EDD64_1467 [Effusibacillus lacus]